MISAARVFNCIVQQCWLLIRLSVLLLCCCVQASTQFEVNYLSEVASRDTYYREALKLALEKTRPTYGNFQFNIVNDVPTKRRFSYIQQNVLPNAIALRGFDEKFYRSSGLAYVNFPIDLGALSIRTCFVSPQHKDEIAKIIQVDEFKKFSIVQGMGWADNIILRDNGFRVIELENYENLFKMVVSGRADMFCRGFNELPAEYAKYKNIGNLLYDESFIIRYKMPYFLFINGSNTLAKKRIEDGFSIAYKDGSLMKLWMHEFKSSIQFSKLAHRKVFDLNNKFLGDIPMDYEKYLINISSLE